LFYKFSGADRQKPRRRTARGFFGIFAVPGSNAGRFDSALNTRSEILDIQLSVGFDDRPYRRFRAPYLQ
jgi:hypothetical protein